MSAQDGVPIEPHDGRGEHHGNEQKRQDDWLAPKRSLQAESQCISQQKLDRYGCCYEQSCGANGFRVSGLIKNACEIRGADPGGGPRAEFGIRETQPDVEQEGKHVQRNQHDQGWPDKGVFEVCLLHVVRSPGHHGQIRRSK